MICIEDKGYLVSHEGVKVVEGIEYVQPSRGEGVVWNEEADFPEGSDMSEYLIDVPRLGANFNIIETGNYRDVEISEYQLMVENRGRKSEYSFQGMFTGQFYVFDRDRFFVESHAPIARGYASTSVYLVNTSQGTASKIIDRTSDVDFDPKRQFWVGYQEGGGRMWHSLEDGRTVWTNEVQVGNWHSGERWVLASGLVLVEDYAFRPER